MIHELSNAGETASLHGWQARRWEETGAAGEEGPEIRTPLALALHCAESTLAELVDEGILSATAMVEVLDEYHAVACARSGEESIPDVLFFLAQHKVNSEAEEEVLDEADKLVTVLLRSSRRRKVVRCPFLNLTRIPSIYREIPAVMQFCRALMIPVVQAHEKELITLATLNPVAGSQAMGIVSQLVEEASGRRPIPAMVVATAAHWRQLNRKHFGA